MYKIGDSLVGTITGIQPYGAFVALDEQTQGLIHISEVKGGYIKNIEEFLTVGETVTVQIIDIDEYSQKISLSLRVLAPFQPTKERKRKRYFTNRNQKIGFTSLAKQMPKWIENGMEQTKNNE